MDKMKHFQHFVVFIIQQLVEKSDCAREDEFES